MKLSEIAAALDARIEGDGAIEIARAVHPAEATGDGDLALAMDKELLALLPGSKARAAVVAEGAALPPSIAGAIVVARPRYAMAGMLDLFERPVHAEPGVHPTAFVAPDAVIGAGASVGAFVYVGPQAVVGERAVLMPHVTVGAQARVGADSLLHAGVRVGERVELGARCIVQPNAAVGNDGFSFVTPEPGSVETAKATGKVGATNLMIRRVNSIGTVIVGDDVEIGAGACIDRGTVTATRIGNGTKIDNLVQIGHNVQIGTNCMLCGQVGIAGSVIVGDRVVMAGKVGIADHVKIGSDCVFAAYSGVGSDVPDKSVYMGIPAMPRSQAFSQLKNLGRLKRLFADVADLKNRLLSVEGRASGAPGVEGRASGAPGAGGESGCG